MNNWSEVLTSNVYKYGKINEPNTFYVDPVNGLDNANRSGNPYESWRTLTYACSRVTTPGNKIHLCPGTITEANIVDVPAGVSIEGEGDVSIIIGTFVTIGNTQATLRLQSAAEGTNGNQTLRNFRMDGQLTGNAAISVVMRSNVKIENVTIVDFNQGGIYFRGGNLVLPVIWATGNEISNCRIINSSTRGPINRGLIRLCGQQDILIHHNLLDQTGHAAGFNGNIIDAVDGNNMGVKFYNNECYKPNTDGGAWAFFLEFWDSIGGMEIYNNRFFGGGCFVDIAGVTNVRGNYPYAWYVHDNSMIQDNLEAMQVHFTVGVAIERNCRDVFITRNYMRNIQFPTYCSIAIAGDICENIHIYYNIFESVGLTDNDWAAGLMLRPAVGAILRTIYFYNNVVIAGAGWPPIAGVLVQCEGSLTDVYIRKNIILNFNDGCIDIYGAAGQTVTLYNQFNIMFGNGNANDVYITPGESITNYVVNDIIKADPLFVSANNFHLQAGSPAINAGLPTFDYTEDFDKKKIVANVNIGAYEQN